MGRDKARALLGDTWLGHGARLLVVSLMMGCGPALAVDVWLTTGDRSSLLEQQQDLIFQPGNGTGGAWIEVNPGTTYQTIEGFGASLTDSAAWLIQNRLNSAQRDALLNRLFNPSTGIGMSYLRLPMGASDFTASGHYTYNDLPPGQTDEFQVQFSITHDQQYIIPQLQQAKALNPNLKLMGSPWSAPAWMKTSGSLIGGSLDSQYHFSYAIYFKRFIDAYAAEGLPIDAITLQNEPLFVPGDYPGMFMSSEQQAQLIKAAVGPVFASSNIDTKIVLYDHNWDEPNYAIDALNDPQVKQYVAGTAFHGYGGDVSAQTTVHNAHPDKGVYFTEISGGGWAPSFADNLVNGVQDIIIGNMRNWGQTALYWNLALDENSGPHQGGCANCRGVVTIDSSGSGAVTPNEEYYTIAHASKFVHPGAVRIFSRTLDNVVETVAFENPDGSKVLIALNPSATSQAFRIVEGGEHVSYQLPSKAVATFTWPTRGADFDNGSFEELGGTLSAWTEFGNPIGNVAASQQLAIDGDHSLKLFGQFNGSGNFSGVSQGMSVTAGDVVRASASSFIDPLDSIVGTGNEVVMKIEFFDKFGGQFGTPDLLSEHQITIADGFTTNNEWLEHMLTGTAPVGAEEARLVFYFFQPNDQAGAVFLDRALIEVIDKGDFNGDGNWNCADINALTAAIAEGVTDLAFDMNGDGAVTLDDVTEAATGWLAVGGANNPEDTGGNPYLPGDANLDGNVDGRDFIAWNSAKFTSNTEWCSGNFNADANVDGQDFIVWNNHKFTSSDSVVVAPEPSAARLLGLVGLLVSLFRSKLPCKGNNRKAF